MFRYENEMIPVIKEHLRNNHQVVNFVDEFNSGNGIADLVCSTKEIQERKLLLDYELMYVLVKYLNRQNKKIEAQKFYKDVFLTKKQAYSLVTFLKEIGSLEQIDCNNYIVRQKYMPPVKEIISIEAKLFDWKNGFHQALRYKSYSNKSFLAISKEYAHRVDLALLKEYGIGLIAVSPDNVEITFSPKVQKPTNIVAHSYLAEKFSYMVSSLK